MVTSMMRCERGFSLAELMVSVAIVGIMASIAFPTYQLFAAKARQSEAKIDLSAIYSAEIAFHSDKDTYTCCLYQAGYAPTGNTFFYDSGFNSSGTCVTTYDPEDPTANCTLSAFWAWNYTSRNDGGFYMNRWANATLNGTGLATEFTAHAADFNAGTFGSIYAENPGFDVWQIDEGKNLVNLQTGF